MQCTHLVSWFAQFSRSLCIFSFFDTRDSKNHRIIFTFSERKQPTRLLAWMCVSQFVYQCISAIFLDAKLLITLLTPRGQSSLPTNLWANLPMSSKLNENRQFAFGNCSYSLPVCFRTKDVHWCLVILMLSSWELGTLSTDETPKASTPSMSFVIWTYVAMMVLSINIVWLQAASWVLLKAVRSSK